MRTARQVWLAPAYVLHQYAYRDTSRIVEVFTNEYGRLTLFARGANGPKSTLRGVLRPFQRMLVSWSGKGEACQLVTAEIDGSVTNLAPNRLMSGFYLNELLLKLNGLYSEMGQAAVTDYDELNNHNNEILNILESRDVQVYYQNDKDWHYRKEERRWVPLNDKSSWRKMERVDGQVRSSIFHIR